jgi:hypothetical protein
MGQYAETYLSAMAELRPKEYARRKGTPSLRAEAEAAEERAKAQEDSALHGLLKQYPEPADYPSRVQHLQGLSQQAREIATKDLVDLEPEAPEPSEPEPTAPPATMS